MRLDLLVLDCARGRRVFTVIVTALAIVVAGCGSSDAASDLGTPPADHGRDLGADPGIDSCDLPTCPETATIDPNACTCVCPGHQVLTLRDLCEAPRDCATDNGGCDPRTACEDERCGPCPEGYTGSGEAGCAVDPSVAPDFSVTLEEVARVQNRARVSYTITNHGAAYAGGTVRVAFYDTGAEAPALGDAGGHEGDAVVPALATDETATLTLFVPAPSSADQGDAWLVIDAADAVLESDETNNVSAAFAWGVPNLRVELLGLTEGSFDGKDTEIAIINDGAAPVAATSVRIGFFADAGSPPTLGTAADRTRVISLPEPLAAFGGRFETTVSFTVLAGGGEAYVRVNDDGAIQESTRDDDVSDGLLWGYRDRPNLRVVVDSVTRTSSTSAAIAYTVYNDGPQPMSTANLQIAYLNTDTPPDFGDFPAGRTTGISSLAAGASVSGTESLAIFSEATGTLYLRVDAGMVVSESSEGDNISAGFVWGADVPHPDLRVRIDGVSEHGNGTATLSYTLFNDGTAAVDASAFDLEYFEDLPSAPAASQFGDATISPAAGPVPASGQISRDATVPSACLLGRSYLFADPYRAIVEFDETNNASPGFDEPGPTQLPDLRIRIDQVSTDELGNLSRIDYTITNDGPGPADSCRLGISFWVGESSPPAPGDPFDYLYTPDTTTLAAGTTRSGSISVSGVPGRTLYLIVNSDGSIPELTLANNVSAQASW